MSEDTTTVQRLCRTTFCPWNWQGASQWREPDPDDPDDRYRCGYCANPLSGYREL